MYSIADPLAHRPSAALASSHPVSSAALANALVDALPILGRAVAEAITHAPHAAGMTFAQFRLLRHLSERDYHPAELAAVVRVSRPTLTVAVDGLERRRLVERMRDLPGDRRSVLVRLTPTGRALYQELRDSATDLLTTHLQHADPDERARIAAGIDALIQLLLPVQHETACVSKVDRPSGPSAPNAAEPTRKPA